MPKSDLRLILWRRPFGDIGGHKASDRTAIALAVALVAVFAAATLWLMRDVMEPRLHEVHILADEAAGTMANSLADDLGAAIGLGIPLAQMRGVEPFLTAALESETLVSEIGILDTSEKVLFRAPAHATLAGTVRAPIIYEGERHGTVEVTPSNGILDRARARLWAAALSVTLTLAMALAVTLRLVAMERINLPRARLGAAAGAVSRGVFADFTPPPEGPLRFIGQRAVRLTSPMRRRQRQLREITEEVRALDTSGILTERIDAALAPLAGLVFDRPMAMQRNRQGRLWWPLFALATLFASRPLVASFVADRIGDTNGASLYIAVTIAMFSLGGLIGLAIAALPFLRGRKIVSLVGLLMAGAAIGATLVIHSPYTFMATQFAAGVGGIAGVAAAFHVEGAHMRRPFRGALVLVAALAIAMPFGTLLAEAEGRRLAFATIGGLCVLAAILSLAGPARRRRIRATPLPPLPLAGAAAALAVSLVIASLVDVNFSVAIFRENYAGLAMATAIMGAAALALPPIFARSLPALAPFAALLAAAAPIAIFFGVPAVVGAGVLGLALGLLVVALGASTLSGPAAIAFLAGPLVAALNRVLADAVSLPGVPLAGGIAAFLAAVALYDQFFRRQA